MKKYILILILSLGSLMSYSQDTSKKVVDTTSLTATKVYNDIKSSLVGLGQALKVGSEHVYAVVIKQQITQSVTDFVIFLMFIVTGLIGVGFAKRTYKAHLLLCGHKPEDSSYNRPDIDDSAKGAASVIISIVSGMCFIAGVVFISCNMTEMITGFTNPEYGAMKDIVHWIK